MSLYSARAKEVSGGVITLSTGEKIKAIGNREFYPGDLVWTDGAYAYGFQGRGGSFLWNEEAEGVPIFIPSYNGSIPIGETEGQEPNQAIFDFKKMSLKIGERFVDPRHEWTTEDGRRWFLNDCGLVNNGKNWFYPAPSFDRGYYTHFDAYMDSEGNTAVFTDTPIGTVDSNRNPIYNEIAVYDKEGDKVKSCKLPITAEQITLIQRPRIDSGKLTFVLGTGGKYEWCEANFNMKTCTVSGLKRTSMNINNMADKIYPLQDGLLADGHGNIYDEEKKLIVNIKGAGYMHAALKLNENTWLIVPDDSYGAVYRLLLLYKDGVLSPVMNNGGMVYTNNYKLHKFKNIKKFLAGKETP